MLAEHFVLGKEEALDSAHEGAAFAGKVGHGLAFESCFEKIARADAAAEGKSAVERMAGLGLINGTRRVDAAAFEEERTHRRARTFGGHHNHVDIFGRHHARAVGPGDCKSMGEVEGFAFGEMRLYHGPLAHNGGIGEQAHYDCAAFAGFFNREKSLARHPSVVDGFFECLALTLAHDNVEAVVAQVQALSGALHAVADNGDSLVFEHFAGFVESKFLAGHDGFFNTAKVKSCHMLYFLSLFIFGADARAVRPYISGI